MTTKVALILKGLRYIKGWTFLIILTSFMLFQSNLPVYKDRAHWEKTGKIIWEVPTEEKVIALTFDDGPSPTFTPQILDILNRFDAKATFFVIGEQAEKFPDIVKQEAFEGHSIGNHMYTHKQVSKMSLNELINNLRRADQLILSLTGKSPHFFRPPDGYYDETIVKAAESLDYHVVIWTWGKDTKDWSNKLASSIAQQIIKDIKNGDIILFHDQGGDRSNTVESLKILLPILKEDGYNFVTIDELMKHFSTNDTKDI